MKKTLRLGCLCLVSFLFVFLLLVADLSIRQNFFYKITLPNGYSLSEFFSRSSYLYNNQGALLLGDHPVPQFCVSSPYVYGWIDASDKTQAANQLSYFVVNTSTGELKTFSNQSDLNTYLVQQGIPRLSMQDSFTFWDIKTGTNRRLGSRLSSGSCLFRK